MLNVWQHPFYFGRIQANGNPDSDLRWFYLNLNRVVWFYRIEIWNRMTRMIHRMITVQDHITDILYIIVHIYIQLWWLWWSCSGLAVIWYSLTDHRLFVLAWGHFFGFSTDTSKPFCKSLWIKASPKCCKYKCTCRLLLFWGNILLAFWLVFTN